MTSVTYRKTYPAAPSSKLVELEELLGARLPEAYRDYLMTQDGGTFRGYNNQGIEIVLGIGEVPKWSSLWFLLRQEGEFLPAGHIPVGSDAGGSLFLLDVTGPNRGSVWYQSSELEEDEDGTTTPVVLERLADSWDEFLASLKPVEE